MQSIDTSPSSLAVKERIANPALRLPVTATGGPILQMDPAREAQQLCEEAEWLSGRNARTLMKHDDLRVVLTVMKAGTKMHRHHAKGSVTIQIVYGHVRVRVLDRPFELRAGQILALDPDLSHDVEAMEEDSAVLVSIAWPRKLELSSGKEVPDVPSLSHGVMRLV